MKNQISLQWLLTASVCASQVHRPVRLARAPAAMYTNTSVQSTTYISTFTSTDSSGSSDDSDYQTFYLPPAVSTKQSECVANSTVTYLESVYPTVFVTVESSYEVTVTARNVSVTNAPTILETPATACVTVILPPSGSDGVLPALQESDSPLPSHPPASSNVPPSTGTPSVHPFLSVVPALTAETTYSIPTQGLRKTSTVVVTKKTPVPVVQVPQDTNPPVTYAQASQTQASLTTEDLQGLAPVATPSPTDKDGEHGNGNNISNNDNNNDDSNSSASSNNGNGGNSNSGGPSGGPSSNSPPSPTPAPLAGAEAGASKLGQIIDSIFNSPFVAPAPAPATLTSPPAAATTIAPSTATIEGIVVTVNAPNVIIGGSVVAIPTAAQSQATVQVNGQAFTVLSDQIVALSTTYYFNPTSAQSFVAVAVPTISTQSASIVTANGVILTVGPTQAIISGTAYQVGPGAPITSVVVDGQTVSIGDNGIAFASTTLAPAITVVYNRYELVSAEDLTISVDASEAIISGTTYSIGPGAVATTIVVGGKTVAIGSSGVVFASTTVHPTGVSPVSSAAGSGTGSGSVSRSGTGSDRNSLTSTALRTSATSSSTAAVRNDASSIINFSAAIAGVLTVVMLSLSPVLGLFI